MPILDFANRLLSAHEQLPSSLQEEGPEPALIRASTSGKRDARAITEAARLLDTYPAGTAAIITTDLEAVKLRSSCPRRDVPPGMIPIRFVTASSGAIRYSADSLTTLRATKDRTIATARDVMRRAVDDEGLTVGQAIQKYHHDFDLISRQFLVCTPGQPFDEPQQRRVVEVPAALRA